MIFSIIYIMLSAGGSAFSLLLGSYAMRYTDASSFELGCIFMLLPFTIFFRVPICAFADRYQSHKRLLVKYVAWTGISYIPFIIIPFVTAKQAYQDILSPRVCFWIVVVFQTSGAVGVCGLRSLTDALSVNFAKRVGSDYSQYRKYGSVSFGVTNLLLGMINQNHFLPDYTPSVITLTSSMLILALLIHLWPDEYFVMVSAHCNDDGKLEKKIPQGMELLSCMSAKLCSTFTDPFRSHSSKRRIEQAQTELELSTQGSADPVPPAKQNININYQETRCLSNKQQISILLLLLRRDIRIPLFMLLIFYGGLVGYAPQNFVFTYMDLVCAERGTCNAAYLAGLVMFSYCIAETFCFIIINYIRKHLNYVVILAITFASITFHYLFYGLMLEQVSPYFFLLEALHGIEYSGSLCSCMELGYRFANEVELLIPELVQKGIISERDDLELVKVSLIATMTGSLSLVYEGLGTIIGALLIGILVEKYSYSTTWIVLGSMAAVGFVLVSLGIIIGKFFKFKPKIAKLTDDNV